MEKRYSSLSDCELIKICKDGKDAENAFTEIYNRYAVKVSSYCKGMISDKDQVQDIFQETFIRFYRSIADSTINNVFPYLVSIARNLSLNYYRNKKITVPLDNIDFRLDERDNYEKKELLDLVVMSLELLEPKYREAFVLRKFDGLSYDEIAEMCSISYEGAKTRVNRARVMIIEILQPYLADLNVNSEKKSE